MTQVMNLNGKVILPEMLVNLIPWAVIFPLNYFCSTKKIKLYPIKLMQITVKILPNLSWYKMQYIITIPYLAEDIDIMHFRLVNECFYEWMNVSSPIIFDRQLKLTLNLSFSKNLEISFYRHITNFWLEKYHSVDKSFSKS